MVMKYSNTFKEFSESNPISNDLKYIKSFEYKISYSKVPLFSDNAIRSVLAGILMDKLIDKLDSLGIYAGNNLKYDIEDNVTITFSDDIYHFGIVMDDSNFVFIRQKGTIQEALTLNELILDEVTSIFEEIASYLRGLKAQGGPHFNFSPHLSSYRYSFHIRDLKPSGKTPKQAFTNYELMERLVPSVQSKDSPLYSVNYERRGRTDLTISGTTTIESIPWTSWIVISAPGNRNFSTFELSFNLQCSISEDENGNRIPFHESSIGKWRLSAIEFLKNKIFCGFLQDWLSDVDFESTES